MKKLKANRCPPGDRWTIIDGGEQIYLSLTETLNQIYMDTGLTQFYMDAVKGEVHVEDGKEKPEPKYTMYGESL